MSPNTPPPVAPASAVVADPKRPWKAIAAFMLTLLGTLWAALEGRDTLDNMTVMEWLSIVVPVILTTGAVYGVRNPKVLDPPPAGGEQFPIDERGESPLYLVVGVIVLIIVVVVLLRLIGAA